MTGLVLFAYAASHLVGHATGLFLLETMDRVGREILLAPWRTVAGRSLLLVALLVHAALGFAALIRRRHLVMPPIEAAQLALGLVIPLLLLPHVVNVRVGAALYALDDNYFRLVYQYWIASPLAGLSRQFALMTSIWVHGCLGLHKCLRFRSWYWRWRGPLLAVAVAIPVLAMLGIMNAGWDLTVRSLSTQGFSDAHRLPQPGTAPAARQAELAWIWRDLQIGYLALLALALAWRGLRLGLARRTGSIAIRYPDRIVRVPRGYSILEASRIARLPHASICGGLARCSTCRVQVLAGIETLAPPGDAERATLDRVGAPPDVRLGCQARPVADIAVRPIISGRVGQASLGLAVEDGAEREVTALAIDLRESTRLADLNLPYDALFVVDRYLNAVIEAVLRHGGYVTSVAGDGVMSVFGLSGPAGAGARRALEAALAVWATLTTLEEALADEVRAPIRFGIGVHSGIAIVGAVAQSGRSSLQFLGDTGNVASRLEALTKDKRCVMIVSQSVLQLADIRTDARLRVDYVALRGREDKLPIVLFSDRASLAEVLGVAVSA